MNFFWQGAPNRYIRFEMMQRLHIQSPKKTLVNSPLIPKYSCAGRLLKSPPHTVKHEAKSTTKDGQEFKVRDL